MIIVLLKVVIINVQIGREINILHYCSHRQIIKIVIITILH